MFELCRFKKLAEAIEWYTQLTSSGKIHLRLYDSSAGNLYMCLGELRDQSFRTTHENCINLLHDVGVMITKNRIESSDQYKRNISCEIFLKAVSKRDTISTSLSIGKPRSPKEDIRKDLNKFIGEV
tara:strand:- start:3164 stop:3541 length:378 start_codon:yes stop_codon:yes gene_type:complete